MANQLRILSILLLLAIAAEFINCHPSPDSSEASNSARFAGMLKKSRRSVEMTGASASVPLTYVDSLPSFARQGRSMTSEEVFKKVQSIIHEQLDVENSDITWDSKIMEDLKADELSLVELILAVEEEFDCDIPDEQADQIKTVGDLFDYVSKHCVN